MAIPAAVARRGPSILTKLSAIARHRDKERLSQGWTQDETGHWIPPGWVRRDSRAGG